MPDDLVVSLSADTMGFIRDMRGAANEMKGVGDTAKKISGQVNTIRFAMAANQIGVMIQDMTTVASMGANFNQILNAGANNLIQMATLVSPIGGALAAAGIAGLQLYNIFSGNVAQAKRLKEEVEATSRAMIGGISSGVDNSRTKADVGEEIGREQEKNKLVLEEWKRNAAEVAKITTQSNLFGGFKTLTAEEQKRVDLLMGQNAEYAKAIAANNTRQLQLEIEKKLVEDIGGLTTKQIREKEEADRKANEELTRMFRERAAEQKKERDDENAAMRLHQQANQKEEQWRLEMENRRKADAEMVRDALMPPEQRLGKEANRLSFLGLTDFEMSATLMKQAQGLFGGGPQLSAGLVKGSIEEESFRNRKEAENRNQTFIRDMVERIIRAMKDALKPEPPPEVVGGGHGV